MTDRNSLQAAKGRAAIDMLLEKIDKLTSADIDWVQIREKDLSAKEVSCITRQALQNSARCSTHAGITRIVVNDRQDVALAEGADGVHLGEASVPASDARELAKRIPRGKRPEFLVGVSCHSLESAVSAAKSGADYIFFGPVFTTPSKAAFGSPQGLECLREVCGKVAVPVIAIGGITVANAALCMTAGAAGIAAIRLFQDAPDARKLVQALRDMLSRDGTQRRPSR